MRQARLLLFLLATGLGAQDGQRPARPEWPCVPGRPVDPAYLETSESTGGQLFLFQRNEVAHAGLVMSAPYTHPATVLRAVGHLSGTRDFEFPVDSTMQTILVMASLQCRNAVQITRPDGSELTASNSAQSVDLQAGRILRVDLPEAGKWRVRLTGTGLFVLSVTTKADIGLTGVQLPHPLLGVAQSLRAYLAGQADHVKFQLAGPGGEMLSELAATDADAAGAYRIDITPPVERFRIVVTGVDAMAWPFQRTHPVLFRAERPK